jgi:hypothetical protein
MNGEQKCNHKKMQFCHDDDDGDSDGVYETY